MISTVSANSAVQQLNESDKLLLVVLENITNATTIYDLRNEYLVTIGLLKVALYPLSTVAQILMNKLEPVDPMYSILAKLDAIVIKNTDNVYDHETETFLEYVLYLDTIYLINNKSFMKLRSKKAKREVLILEETLRTISGILQQKTILLMLYRLYITLTLRIPLEHLHKAVQEKQDPEIINNLSNQVANHIKILRYASNLGLKGNIAEKDYVTIRNNILELVILGNS